MSSDAGCSFEMFASSVFPVKTGANEKVLSLYLGFRQIATLICDFLPSFCIVSINNPLEKPPDDQKREVISPFITSLCQLFQSCLFKSIEIDPGMLYNPI